MLPLLAPVDTPAQAPQNMGDVLLVSLLAIAIVFAVLVLIIFISWLFSQGIGAVQTRTQINPKPENKILETDEDAVVAALVATIDFHKKFNKNARLVSIEEVNE